MTTITLPKSPVRRIESAILAMALIVGVFCWLITPITLGRHDPAANAPTTIDKIYADCTLNCTDKPVAGQTGYPALTAKTGQTLQIRSGRYTGGPGGDLDANISAGVGGPALRIPAGANVDLCGGTFIGGFGGSGSGFSGPSILIDGGTLIVHGSNLVLDTIEGSNYCILSGIYPNSQPLLMTIQRMHGANVVLTR